MASNLELIGINERSGLITPNLYKQDWTVPSSVVDNYSVVHTRALSDITTPIYGKGTGIFLDTANGGGEYDINGNMNHLGSGRLNAFIINTAQWSYSPTTPYSATNTRALSDTTTPIYGKGTGVFLDTTNGGGDYEDDEMISEGRKKTGTKLCARGKATAKSKFEVYPSAYANAFAVQVCKGTKAGLDGKKRCSGVYC